MYHKQCSKLEIITDASKSGVANETLQNAARRASKVMTEQEARQILGVSENTAWEEIAKASIVCLTFFPSFPLFSISCPSLETFSIAECRSMTLYLREMPRMGVSTFNQRFIGPRSA